METLAELHKTVNNGITRDELRGAKQAVYMGVVSFVMWAVQDNSHNTEHVQQLIQRCELGTTVLDIINDDDVDADFMRDFLHGKTDYKILEQW